MVVFDVTWGRGGVYNLVSVAGLFVYVSLVCACSSRPAMVGGYGVSMRILLLGISEAFSSESLKKITLKSYLA